MHSPPRTLGGEEIEKVRREEKKTGTKNRRFLSGQLRRVPAKSPLLALPIGQKILHGRGLELRKRQKSRP